MCYSTAYSSIQPSLKWGFGNQRYKCVLTWKEKEKDIQPCLCCEGWKLEKAHNCLICYKSPFPIFSCIQTIVWLQEKTGKQLKLNKVKQSLKQNLADTV